MGLIGRCAKLAIGTLVVALLPSCIYAPGEEYIHEPTEALRDSLYHRDKFEGLGGRDLVLVPTFQYFREGYAENERRASLIFLASDSTRVRVERVLVTNRDTGHSLDVNAIQVIEVDNAFENTGFYRESIPLISSSENAPFINADSLHVQIWYRLSDRRLRTEEFDIQKVTRWEWKSITV